MRMDENQNESIKIDKNFLKQLRTLSPEFCDRCGAKHVVSDLSVIKSEGQTALCKIGCKSCGNNYMMHAVVPMEGVVASRRGAFNADINTKELEKFSQATQIDTDEVIDVFSQLKDVNNIDDFNKLTQSKKKIGHGSK